MLTSHAVVRSSAVSSKPSAAPHLIVRALRAPRPVLVAVLLHVLSVSASHAGTTTRYVDPNAMGADNGTSWEDAFNTLEQALDVAASGDEIRIAVGIYTPSLSSRATDPSATFLVPQGVTLRGGFAGAGTTSRGGGAGLTVLSGDLTGDDDDPDGDGVLETWTDQVGINASHVVTLDDTISVAVTSLVDLVITSGSATGAAGDDRGAAIDCAGLSLALDGVLIQANHSASRAALWNCSVVNAVDSTIRNNRGGDVGAVTTSGGSWERCLLEGNTAGTQAAVFYMSGQDVTMKNSTVRNNSSGSFGGPLRHQGGTQHYENVLFVGNQGGAGVFSLSETASTTIVGSTFVGNNGTQDNGAILVSGPSPTVSVTNTVFWNNGGGFLDARGSTAGQPIVLSDPSASVTVSYSIVQDSVDASGDLVIAGVTDGGNNADDDPLFSSVPDVVNAPFDDVNVHLRPGSPALEAGDNGAVTTTLDLDGNDRIGPMAGSIVDLGAFEGASAPVALSITKFDGLAGATPGATTVQYTIVTTNDEDYAAEVRTVDPIDDERLINCSWTATPSGAGDGDSTSGVGAIDDTRTLTNSVQFDLTCDIDPGATGTLTNTATAAAVGLFYDDATNNNSATDADTELFPLVDLEPSIAGFDASSARGSAGVLDFVVPGQQVELLFDVDNQGPSDEPEANLVATWPTTVFEACTITCVDRGEDGQCPVSSVDETLGVPAGVTTGLGVLCTVRADAPTGPFEVNASVVASKGVQEDVTGNNVAVLASSVLGSEIFSDGFESGGTTAWQ